MENKCFKGGCSMFTNKQQELCDLLNDTLREKNLVKSHDKFGYYDDYYYYFENGKMNYGERKPQGKELVTFEYFQKWLLEGKSEPNYEIY